MWFRNREFPDGLTLRWDHVGLHRAPIQWLVSVQAEIRTPRKATMWTQQQTSRRPHLQVEDRQGFLASARNWEKQEVNLPLEPSEGVSPTSGCLSRPSSRWQFLKVYYEIFIIHYNEFHDCINNVFLIYSLPITLSCPSLRSQLLSWGIFSTNQHYKRIT